MIDKKIYNLEYVRELQAKYKTDPGLLERVLYAFGLLEALVKVGMKFTFKGGSNTDFFKMPSFIKNRLDRFHLQPAFRYL